MSTASRHLLLLGGGHAHLEVIRQFAARPLNGGRVTLVSTFGWHHYSSVVPAYLQERADEQDFAFDLAAICRSAGVEFIAGCAESIDTAGRRVTVMSTNQAENHRRTLTYDELSIDVGSVPAGLSIAGVRKHAFTVRPMSNAIALKQRLDVMIASASARKAGNPDDGCADISVCIVGAGAGGVEIALAIARRLGDEAVAGMITLVDQGDAPLGDYAPQIQRRVAALLEQRGITLSLGRSVVSVGGASVQLDDGTQCPAALTIWLTGAAAPPLFHGSALVTDTGGFLIVDATLRSVSEPHVWGAGDCVALRDHPQLAKAGVYAVREGPVLAHNLRVAIEGGRLRRYEPQRQFMAILDTGDDRGLLRWRRFSWHARWALFIKQLIDRRFVLRYQRLEQSPQPKILRS